MKKLLVTIFVLLIALTACTAEGTPLEETAATATKDSLQAAPTATAEPTAEPTATDIPTATPEPAPTETAEVVPTATKETQSDGDTGTIPDEIELPDGAVIVFTQTGGFAGFDDTWVFYPDGQVTFNGVEQSPLTPERINEAVTELETLGFFEMTHITKPGTFCCDFFDYTLAVQTQDNQNFVSFSDGNPDLPQELSDALAVIRELINEAQLR
jgi:hypothetical protein